MEGRAGGLAGVDDGVEIAAARKTNWSGKRQMRLRDRDGSGQSERKASAEFLTVLMSFSLAFNTLREACTLIE